jgi:hypothetical protein
VIIIGGNLARNSLQSSDRFKLPFDQIECPSPPGVDRATFLSDVRYYGEFPKVVSVLDDSLRDRLADAFAQHPWVEKVGAVEVGPSRQIRAELTFRTPVIAIEYFNPGPVTRVVDGSGVLLPLAASAQLLPHLTGERIQNPPAAGQLWGSSQVEAAAHVAKLLQPQQSTLKLMQFRWQDGQLHLRSDSSARGPEVIWGSPPGAETNGEPTADVKVRRLLDQADQLNNSAHVVIDLRAP